MNEIDRKFEHAGFAGYDLVTLAFGPASVIPSNGWQPFTSDGLYICRYVPAEPPPESDASPSSAELQPAHAK